MEKKILVVDDNRLSREINCSTLESAGYKTIMASDGNEGLSLLKAGKIDLIILDLIMPGLDGFGFLSVCKADPLSKDIPVIVITGRDSPEEVKMVKDLGASECLVKHRMPPIVFLKSVKTALGV